MSGTFGDKQAVQLSVRDMQGLKDEVKEHAGGENPLKPSDHSMSVVWTSTSQISVHVGINRGFCENEDSGSVCLGWVLRVSITNKFLDGADSKPTL